MHKFLVKLNRIDAVTMCGIYFLDLLIAIIYMFLIWQENYFSDLSIFFIIYFSFFCGASIVIDVLLIQSAIQNVISIKRLHLLIAYIIIETSIILANCIYYGTGVGDFWSDGYIFFILDFVMIISYSRRYFILREFKTKILAETEEHL